MLHFQLLALICENLTAPVGHYHSFLVSLSLSNSLSKFFVGHVKLSSWMCRNGLFVSFGGELQLCQETSYPIHVPSFEKLPSASHAWHPMHKPHA